MVENVQREKYNLSVHHPHHNCDFAVQDDNKYSSSRVETEKESLVTRKRNGLNHQPFKSDIHTRNMWIPSREVILIVNEIAKDMKEMDKLNLQVLVSLRDRKGFADFYKKRELSKEWSAAELCAMWDTIVQKLKNGTLLKEQDSMSNNQCEAKINSNENDMDYRKKSMSLHVMKDKEEEKIQLTGNRCKRVPNRTHKEKNTRPVKTKKWYSTLVCWTKNPHKDLVGTKTTPTTASKRRRRFGFILSARGSIASEKSNTYFLDLKPPSSQPPLLHVCNQLNPNLLLKSKHLSPNDCEEEEEDIFICV